MKLRAWNELTHTEREEATAEFGGHPPVGCMWRREAYDPKGDALHRQLVWHAYQDVPIIGTLCFVGQHGLKP